MRRINVGVIGCGAVAELCHLPAIKNIPTIKIKALADVNRRDIKLKGKTIFKEGPIRIPLRGKKDPMIENHFILFNVFWRIGNPQLQLRIV